MAVAADLGALVHLFRLQLELPDQRHLLEIGSQSLRLGARGARGVGLLGVGLLGIGLRGVGLLGIGVLGIGVLGVEIGRASCRERGEDSGGGGTSTGENDLDVVREIRSGGMRYSS